MFTASASSGEDRPDAAVVRKLYKTCVDCVKRIDQSTKDKKDVKSLFLPAALAARNRLRDSCEKLMFINPGDFGRKAEDMIWKKCFYDPIQILRFNKETLSDEHVAWTWLFLSSAAGYYHGLLIKLQEEFGLRLNSDFSQLSLEWKPASAAKHSGQDRKRLREWAVHAAQKCLIYLGDLGMPYNQLGTLFGMRNWGVDAVYYYFRCFYSVDSFDGVKGNLIQMFNRNDKMYDTLNTTMDGNDDGNHKVKVCLVTFLYLIGALFEDKPELSLGSRLQLLCQQLLDSFENCLPLLSSDESPFISSELRHINANLVLKMVLIAMFLIKKLQDESSTKLSSAIALLLSMFSKFLDHLLSTCPTNEDTVVLEKVAVHGNKDPKSAEVVQAEEDTEIEQQKEPQSVPELNGNLAVNYQEPSVEEEGEQKDDIVKISRRRRGSESSVEDEKEEVCLQNGTKKSQSDLEQSEGDDEEDVIHLSSGESEGELSKEPQNNENNWAKLVEIEWKRTNSPLDNECSEPQHQQAAHGEIETHQAKSEQQNDDVSKQSAVVPAVKSRFGMDSLIVVKVVSDWFRSNPDLIASMTETSKMLWCRLSTLLNLLPNEDLILQHVMKDHNLRKTSAAVLWSPITGWSQKLPLPEDITLRGVPFLSQIHSGLDFSRTEKIQEKDVEEGWKSDSLMRNMAKLRVKDELAQLSRIGWIPVYIIPDTSALVNKLGVFKQLAGAKRFVCVIPQTTIQELDGMKKDSANAREAIRYLEMCFRQGNKHVRPQKPKETMEPPQPLKNGKKQGTSELFEILRCCSYFGGKVNNSGNATVVVTVVTSQAVGSVAYKDYEECLNAAGIKGANVENVQRFLSRWQSYRKKGG